MSTPGSGDRREVCRIPDADFSSDQGKGQATYRPRRKGGRGDFGGMWKFSLWCWVKPQRRLDDGAQTLRARPQPHTSLPTLTEGRTSGWKVDRVSLREEGQEARRRAHGGQGRGPRSGPQTHAKGSEAFKGQGLPAILEGAGWAEVEEDDISRWICPV